MRALPSLITLTAMTAAFTAVVQAMEGNLGLAGVCILIGYVLDATDGALARRLNVVSNLGRQLDSLADMVTFGVAPTLLLYRHLAELGARPLLAWFACVAYLGAGAFRLARFNLLPTKTDLSDSLGLTVSTSGATLTLLVLVNEAYGNTMISAPAMIGLCAALAALMASRIRYPALAAILRRRKFSIAVLGLVGVMALQLPPPVAGLSLTGGYVCFGVIRALVDRG